MKKFVAVLLVLVLSANVVGFATAETAKIWVTDVETSEQLGEILDGQVPIWVMWILYHKGLERGTLSSYLMSIDDQYNPNSKTVYYTASENGLYLTNLYCQLYAEDEWNLAYVWSLTMLDALKEINAEYSLGLTLVELTD